MNSPRALILFNSPTLPPDDPEYAAEQEIEMTVDAVEKALREAGFLAPRLGVGTDPDVLIKGVRRQRPDVVVNLFEGLAEDARTEGYAVGILEWLGVPYTGSPLTTLCLAQRKPLAKHLFMNAGLPTPEFFVMDRAPIRKCPLEFPVIVKPAEGDASVGIEQASVAKNLKQLNERADHIIREYRQPALVEQFIRGRELNVALIETPELETLPISEILFIDEDPDFWPIITYKSKWDVGSREDLATPPRYPADVDTKLARQLQAIARKAYRLLGCRDYARVDFRVDADGQPYVLEVNPNPDFSPNAGLAKALATAGISFNQFCVDLVRHAMNRPDDPKTFDITYSSSLASGR
ncbi:MAG: ATP-grasp domain-containing protein [Gemmataceae bacterium]